MNQDECQPSCFFSGLISCDWQRPSLAGGPGPGDFMAEMIQLMALGSLAHGTVAKICHAQIDSRGLWRPVWHCSADARHVRYQQGAVLKSSLHAMERNLT